MFGINRPVCQLAATLYLACIECVMLRWHRLAATVLGFYDMGMLRKTSTCTSGCPSCFIVDNTEHHHRIDRDPQDSSNPAPALMAYVSFSLRTFLVLYNGSFSRLKHVLDVGRRSVLIPGRKKLTTALPRLYWSGCESSATHDKVV